MKHISLLGACLCFFMAAQAKTVRVLFIGNSYTAVNDLPLQVSQMADGSHDTLVYDVSAPGGYTFAQHTTYSPTLSKIQVGGWDYVVLQEQSQLPSFPDAQVATDVYPYAHQLDSIIHEYNPCAKTMFYVTWGRKNGDASNCGFFPPVCTYEGMDSLLQLRYTKMAENNGGVLSPVAMVWHQIRNMAPTIELYNADESHPSLSGTFAAACTFYSVLFEKSPLQSNYTAGLNAGEVNLMKTLAESTVYDSLDHWNRFLPVVSADFSPSVTGSVVSFTNNSLNANEYTWDFGDGQNATIANPSHTYAAAGTYTVTLIAKHCAESDTTTQSVTIAQTAVKDLSEQIGLQVYPVPAQDQLSLQYDPGVQLSAISLCDITGKIVYKRWKAQSKLNLEGIPAGTYILILDTDKGIARRKITIR